MAKYQTYEEYKDSGVEFLPILPSTWKVGRVKSILDLQRTIVGEKSKYYQLLSLTLRGVILRDVSGGDGKIPESFDTYQAVKKKDLVFCLFDMDETPRTVGISEHDGMITGAYNVYKVNKSSFPKFIYYYFLHLDYFKGLKPFYTGLRKVVRSDTFANIKMPCPPLAEQTQIANFLDHETTKIDHLIEKQQQLIELLKEKRQAVISHAVTKGLDPNVPMKDSGVEWLGEVPEHWGVSSIGYYAKVTNGTTPSKANLSYWDKQEIPWLSSGEVNQYYIVEASEYITKKALEECSLELLPIGTVVMGMIGQGKTRGLSAITRLEATINQNLAALEAYPKLNNEYLHYYLQATYDYIREEGRGGNQAALNCEIIRKFPITIPPLEEQVKIIKQIKNLSVTFKALIRKAESAIQLMQERRTALISAAVTGKIDVRNWQAPTLAEAHTEFSA